MATVLQKDKRINRLLVSYVNKRLIPYLTREAFLDIMLCFDNFRKRLRSNN